MLTGYFQLPASASEAELRDAYYAVAKRLHPDVAGEERAADFKHAQEASALQGAGTEERLRTPRKKRRTVFRRSAGFYSDGPISTCLRLLKAVPLTKWWRWPPGTECVSICTALPHYGPWDAGPI